MKRKRFPFRRRPRRPIRRGATAVEVAMVFPVFVVFIFFLVEYGRAQMVANMLQASCRAAARYGSTEGVTSNQAMDRLRQVMDSTVHETKITITVKDANVYDEGGDKPDSEEDFNGLPNIELDDAEPRRLFLVRAQVTYNEIAMLSFPWLENVKLTGQAFMRHE